MFEFKDIKSLKLPPESLEGYNYESPIWTAMERLQSDMLERQENEIVLRVQEKLNVNIDKDELVKALLYDRNQYDKGFADAKAAQKTGEWEITDAYPHNVYCSVCHTRYAQTHWQVWEDLSLPRKYCPNCGAKMGSDEQLAEEEKAKDD